MPNRSTRILAFLWTLSWGLFLSPFVYGEVESQSIRVGHLVLNRLLVEHFGKWRSVSLEPSPRIMTVPLSSELPSRGRLGGVAVGPDGYVYVSNFGATVWKISPGGEVERLVSSLKGSSGNTVDKAGNLLQASFLDGRIIQIDPDGRITTRVESGLEGPVGLVSDPDHRLFVCNCRGNSVAVVDREGKIETLVRGEPLDCPNGITWGPQGRLYVVSFNNGDVVQISRDGSMRTVATLPGGGNAHIAFARGSFFITQIGDNQIYRMSLKGDYQLFAGTGVLGQEDGPVREGTLSRPNGIAFDRNRGALYINNLVGTWRGDEETHILLRRIDFFESQ